MLCRILLPGLLAVALAGDLHGQTTSRVSPGERVRVTTTEGKGARVFTISHIDSTTIVVNPAGGGPSHAIASSQVKRMDRSVGPRPRGEGALRGAGAGFAVGAILGAGLGAMTGGECGVVFCHSRSEGAATVGGVLGAVGGSIGALFGALRPGEKWQRVELPAAVSVAPLLDGGVRVGYSRAF